MKLKEFYSKVSRSADTANQQIGVDDVSRVLSQVFLVLAQLPAHEVAVVLSQGLCLAKNKLDKSPAVERAKKVKVRK